MKPSIVSHSVAGKMVVTLRGELGSEASPDLRSALLEAGQAGLPVVIDLSHVTFIDSSTVGVFITAHRRLATQGHSLVLVGASARITTVLRMTGLLRLLDVKTAAADDEPSRC